jgi:ribulose-phosphate 3-epimerase
MSRQASLKRLQNSSPLIAPSMLKCDFGNLQREISLLESAGGQVLHLDVMDGHFVPNLSYGPLVIERLRSLTSMPFDAHLMISDPAKYLDEYLAAGCDSITIHFEAVREPGPLLERIRRQDAMSGLAINPGTPVDAIVPYLPLCDLVLVMSVEPGFGGQKFMPVALEKLRALRARLPENALLSVDGGIGPKTISECSRAGASVFVVGSAIFDARDYGEAIREMTALVSDAAVEGQLVPPVLEK